MMVYYARRQRDFRRYFFPPYTEPYTKYNYIPCSKVFTKKKKRENAVYTLWHARYDLLSFIRTS